MTVRDGLPELIEREGFLPIKVVKYPFDFRNVFKDMERIPKLWSRKLNVYDLDASEQDTTYVDGMIHMGMQPEESSWLIEIQARRDGYQWVGDDGKPIPPRNGGPGDMFEGLPDVLKPMYDVEGIGKILKKKHPVSRTSHNKRRGI